MNEIRHIEPGLGARVRVLATTDLHMHLTSFDYYADRPDPTVGLTRIASLIGQARCEATENGALTLLFDNGDALQGTPLADLVSEQSNRSHPMMRAFGHLRFDAVGLGNHDFNYGLKTLDRALLQAPCPVLSSNMRRLGQAKPCGFAPFAILDRIIQAGGDEWPIRIGVLSFLPPQTALWDGHLLRDLVEVDDILDSARRWLPEMKQAGCDLILALAHTGLDQTDPIPAMENAVIPLAALDGIDGVIAGHTHLHLPGIAHAGLPHVDADTGSVHGKPVVMAGSSGSHLGVIDFELEAKAGGGWTISGFQCALRPVARRDADGAPVAVAGEDQELVRVLAEDHADTRSLMAQVIGHSDQTLHSYFTFFAPDRSLALVAQAQAAALRPFLADSEAEALPLLSATAPGKFGARAGPEHFTDVPAGPLSLRHVADLHVFPNEIRAVIITGQQVFDWLEMSASLFHQIIPGSQGGALVDPQMPGHNFDVLHGLQYQIDLSAPARFNPDGSVRNAITRRVQHVSWQGRPVTDDQRFAVAVNSYRLGGGGNVAALVHARQVTVPHLPIRDALCRYLTRQYPIDPLATQESVWSFVPLPGTSATVLTGPGAVRHLPELADRGVTKVGVDYHGFLHLNVPL